MNARPITLFLLIAHILGFSLWAEQCYFWALGVFFFTHMTVLWGILMPCSQLLGRVVTSVDSGGKNEVYLTIDDGPHPENTPAVLELLERRKVKATFFLIGDRARRHPALVRAIRDQGHDIGNHTMTHPSGSFWCSLPGRIRREIAECDEALGQETKLFRAPAGLKSWFLHSVLESAGMGKTLVGWSARGFDAVRKDRSKIIQRILAGLKPGAIILMHEARVGSEDEWTFSAVELIEGVLDAVEERGYSFGELKRAGGVS